MGTEEKPAQVWSGVLDGREHRVEVSGSWSRRIRWTVDGELAAEIKKMDDRIRVDGKDHGKLLVIHSTMGTPQRATVFPPGQDIQGATGLGGTDLTPEPGSKAAAYERKVIEHPTRYSVLQTLGGVGKVVVPILLVALIAWIPKPNVNLPNIPWPDVNLPNIPWPDLPSIPWPSIDLPAVTLPDWLVWILDNAHYIIPIVAAFVLARAEVRRRRRHLAEKESEQAAPASPTVTQAPDETAPQSADEGPNRQGRGGDGSDERQVNDDEVGTPGSRA